MTARLCAWTVSQWSEVDGALRLEGVSLLELRFASALNVVYALLLRNKDEKARDKITRELNAPLPGESVEQAQREASGPWSDEAQGSAFMMAMAGQE